MSWEDRSYYRDGGNPLGHPLNAVLFGSVPIFSLFGVRVRAHSWLFLCIAGILLIGFGKGFTWNDRLMASAALLALLLVHEFSHVAVVRRLGGETSEVVLFPLGGLTEGGGNRRPRAMFLAAAAGPVGSLVICIAAGVGLAAMRVTLPVNPYHPFPRIESHGWQHLSFYLAWVYAVSLTLLVLNLLPILPLDGGQMVQAALSARCGPTRARKLACDVGIGASLVLVASAFIGEVRLWLVCAGMSLFVYCLLQRRALVAAVQAEAESGGTMDYSQSLHPDPPRRRRRLSRRVIRRLRRLAQQEEAEQVRIDVILSKVSAEGIHSLTWWERRALRQATERQRRRETVEGERGS